MMPPFRRRRADIERNHYFSLAADVAAMFMSATPSSLLRHYFAGH
jgi:hypothetical protein